MRERAQRLVLVGDGHALYDGQPRILLGLPHVHLVAPHHLKRIEEESLLVRNMLDWVYKNDNIFVLV